MIIFVRKLPERPTKGIPCSSSLAPGASPINIISGVVLPCPGTVLVRVLHNEQFMQALICAVISVIVVPFGVLTGAGVDTGSVFSDEVGVCGGIGSGDTFGADGIGFVVGLGDGFSIACGRGVLADVLDLLSLSIVS